MIYFIMVLLVGKEDKGKGIMDKVNFKAYNDKGILVGKMVDPALVTKAAKLVDLFGPLTFYWHDLADLADNTLVVHLGSMTNGTVFVRADDNCKFRG